MKNATPKKRRRAIAIIGRPSGRRAGWRQIPVEHEQFDARLGGAIGAHSAAALKRILRPLA